VENLTFGDNNVDLVSENGTVTVRAARPFTLLLNGTRHEIPAGASALHP
jgi:hypothetical protein